MRLLSLTVLCALAAAPNSAQDPAPSAAPSAPPATAAAPALEARTNPLDGLEYVRIPAGQFLMGCVPRDLRCSPDELPRHVVRISKPFWAGRTEVTVQAFRKFVEATKYAPLINRIMESRQTRKVESSFSLVHMENRKLMVEAVGWEQPGFRQGPDHPVVLMAYTDAEKFCSWSGGRLPTEAEWEYMARGGGDSELYPWTQEENKDVANFTREKDLTYDKFDLTAPVASFPPNGYGLYDLIGNVLEWTSDRYQQKYYATSPGVDPPGAAASHFRVRRGGSFLSPLEKIRLSARDWGVEELVRRDFGIRCVRDKAP